MLKYIINFVSVLMVLFSISYIHYWIAQGAGSGYYLFFYGFAGMFLGGLVLLRWGNVESGAQLTRRLNKDNNAEKEDQDSLKYGTLLLFPSMILVLTALSTSTFV